MEKLQRYSRKFPCTLNPEIFNVNILHHCGIFAKTKKPILVHDYTLNYYY